MLPIEPDTILKELQDTRAILAKWVERLEGVGFPALDHPGSDEALEEFVAKLAGELVLVSGRCETLSTVLLGPR